MMQVEKIGKIIRSDHKKTVSERIGTTARDNMNFYHNHSATFSMKELCGFSF